MIRIARVLAALLGAAGLAGLYFEFYAARGLRGFVEYASYFTNISNAGYIAVLLALAFVPARVKPSAVFRAFQGTVTMAMVLTGVGYAALLSDTMSYFRHPWINYVVHGVMPLIALLDWLVFPPGSPKHRFRVAAWQWLIYPAVWSLYTLGHGWASGWYPYPFLYPDRVGTLGVLTAAVAGFLTLLAIIAALVAYQRWRLSERGNTANPAPSVNRWDASAHRPGAAARALRRRAPSRRRPPTA